MIAVSVGSAPITDLLLQNGADVTLANENKQTPLHYAASKAWLDIAKLLIAAGANTNSRDHLGQTPLHRVAAKGNVGMLTYFLSLERLQLDVEDKAENTPLHLAVEFGHAELAIRLIEAGADFEVKNKKGLVPLQCAPDKNVEQHLNKYLRSRGSALE
jgi:26S proteasome non-ATPase regulatory subunit 10